MFRSKRVSRNCHSRGILVSFLSKTCDLYNLKNILSAKQFGRLSHDFSILASYYSIIVFYYNQTSLCAAFNSRKFEDEFCDCVEEF